MKNQVIHTKSPRKLNHLPNRNIKHSAYKLIAFIYNTTSKRFYQDFIKRFCQESSIIIKAIVIKNFAILDYLDANE